MSVPIEVAGLITILLFLIGYLLGKRNGAADALDRISTQAFSTGTINFGVSEAYTCRRIQEEDLQTRAKPEDRE